MKDIFAKKDKRSELEKEYDTLVEHLKAIPESDKAYAETLEKVEKLHALLMEEKDRKKSISPETVLGVVANALSIVMILKHEQMHSITSKALNFVTKGRVR